MCSGYCLQVVHPSKERIMFWKLFNLTEKLDWIFSSDWICLDGAKRPRPTQ